MIPEFPTEDNMKPVLSLLTMYSFKDQYGVDLGRLMVWDDLTDWDKTYDP
jgi:hypothetical protein